MAGYPQPATRCQAPVGPTIVDFVCLEAMLTVELDGGQHGDEEDRSRQALLEQRGDRVLRFPNDEVVEKPAGVLEVIGRGLTSGGVDT